MRETRLYLIVGPQHGDEIVAAALAGGVDAVQLRDKESDDDRYLARAREIAARCHERGARFLVNDRWQLVEDAGADGVHLGQEDRPIEQVRRALGPGALLGLSTHDRVEAQQASERGADYVGLGPMFPTCTKQLERTPGGPALLESVAGATDLPIFPIGGINADTLPRLIAAGARRAAVSSAIADAADPCATAKQLRALLTGF